MWQYLLWIGINVVILWIMFLYFRAKLRRALEVEKIVTTIRKEVNDLVSQLNQISDRNISILENKIDLLTKLLEDADKRIVTLSREKEKQALSKDLYTKLRPKITPIKIDPIKEDPAESEKKDEEYMTNKGPLTKNIRTQVMELSRQGFDSKMIAQKLDTTLGEVELIISLSRGKE